MPYLSIAIRSTPIPKAKPENFLRIIADESEHCRIDHAGAENFQPAGSFTNAASLTGLHRAAATANYALDIDLRARFGKGEKTRSETHAGSHAEKFARNTWVSTPLRSANEMCLVHHESFDLMKHRRVSGVVIVAINRAGDDDLQRRLAVFHGPDLHRRGVRP